MCWIPYIYVFVRQDISMAQQAVQSCHASVELARSGVIPLDVIPNLIILQAKDEGELLWILDKIDGVGIRTFPFKEPDIGGQYTAFATEPVVGDNRKLFRKYKLIK